MKVELFTLGRWSKIKKRNNEWVLISENEVSDAVARTKYGKAIGLDDRYVELITKNEKAVVERVITLCNVCY